MSAPFPVPDAAYDYATARATESARYGGGLVYVAPLGTPPPTVEILPGRPVTRGELVNVMVRANPEPFVLALRQIGEMAEVMRPWFELLAEKLAPERPVVRARRLRVEQAMRQRARHAARRQRQTARRAAAW